MINLAVVNGKDLIKYIIKLAITIFFIVIASNVFSGKKNSDMKIKLIEESTFIGCLDDNIPGMKELNSKDEESTIRSEIEPLKLALKLELEMLDSMAVKDENTEDNENIEENIENNVEEIVEPEVEHAKTGLTTEVIENNVPNKYTDSYKGVQVKNSTDYVLTEDMLNPDVEVNNSNVLIFHTHTCESYTASENFNYTQTGTYRTTDLNYNVARVGTELARQLSSYNYNVIHDKTYHDYPAYSGSYERSLTTVENLLKENENTDVVFDLHRDAIGDYSYAPTVKIGEEYAAQLMFVIGTDGGGLEHPNWQQNLKFAIKIQEKANELYPGLFKPIILRNTRYNQHLAKGASIIEVGATGNTMEQCLNSMKFLARVLSEVMK